MIADNKRDFLWVLLAAALILIGGSIPTWIGYQAQTPELRFRGTYYDNQDYAVHLAAMEAGRHGDWAYRFRFTSEPHKPAYVRLFYTTLGHVSKWTGLASEIIFQLARWILGFLALIALYRLMRQVFSDRFWARTAFLLAALGSGLGWLQLILNLTSTEITPIDFWLIDSYVFFSLSVFPHYAFVTLGMCLSLNLYLTFLASNDWRNVIGIALTSIVVQFVNPIAFATIDASLVGATLFKGWHEKRFDRVHILGLITIAIAQIPLLAYNVVILSNDPLWSRFTSQNLTLSPPPDYYFWGFAFFWPLAILGTINTIRKKSYAWGAALFWIIAAFTLAYAPVEIQRRFLQNITIPLGILATAGLMTIFETEAARSSCMLRWLSSSIMLFIFITSLSSIQLGLGQAAYLRTYPKSLYYPASLDNAVNWFRANAEYNDFVMASEQTSQILAQKAGLRAYFGHEMETLYYKNKKKDVLAFYQGESPELASHPIKWVVYGPYEREISPNFRQTGHLELVYDIQGLQIYEVK